jgi:hypothetical protein
MMASRKSGAGVSRPRQMSSKKGGMVQFAFIGVAIVVVIVGALLLFGSGGKKPARTKAKASSADEGLAKKSRGRKSPAVALGAGKSGRDDVRARRREERLKRRQEARAAGGSRTSRSSSGGYDRGSSSRGSSASPNQLRAILTDGEGSRFALVGERRFKSGDDIEGRRILEVSSDGIKMEYRQNTYTVKVGQKVY